jgi:ATP-dependent Clp protease ATP-binding subunit ClpA
MVLTMYERFTDKARKVMKLANREAIRLNHKYIGTEHILLGLVEDGSGVAANALKNLDIDLRKIRREIEKTVQSGSYKDTMGTLPQTPRAKKVLEYSIEEARNFNHNYVGTEHLLLGLFREEDGVASQVLKNFGLKLEDLREEILNLLGQPPANRRDPGSTQPRDLPRTDLNTALLFLPEELLQVLKEVSDRLEEFAHQKEEAIAEHDLETAADFRDKSEMIRRQLMDVAKNLLTFLREIRESPE